MANHFVLALALLTVIIGCVHPQPVKNTVLIHPNCPEIPATTFAAVNLDAKAGAVQFGKLVTLGELTIKTNPELLSAVSQSVRDDQVTDALICAARERGELKTDEQIAHAWKVARFYRLNPTPELAMKFHKEHPFPTTSSGQEPRDSNERANRAWLTVKGLRAPFRAVVNGSAEMEIIYQNTGRSPAQHIVFSAMTAVQLPDWSPPDPMPTDPNQQQNIGVVGPGQSQILYFGRTRPFTVEEIDVINHGRAVLFYAGQVRYEDQFSKSRGLQFCLRYEPPKDEKPVNYMIPCSSYDKVW